MATHSSVLAWRIPGTGEPGGLPSMGPRRVGHDGRDAATTCAIFSVHILRSGIAWSQIQASTPFIKYCQTAL